MSSMIVDVPLSSPYTLKGFKPYFDDEIINDVDEFAVEYSTARKNHGQGHFEKIQKKNPFTYVGSWQIKFGKNKGRLYKDVCSSYEGKDYLKWLAHEKGFFNNPKYESNIKIKEYIDWETGNTAHQSAT